MNIGNVRSLKDLKGLEKDDLLEVLGLETRKSASDFMLPALAIFGVGFLLGAGLGLMLAPKSGAELRGELRARLQREGDEAGGFPPATGLGERASKTT